ncbi:hypothetical protein STEG23_001994 [Scotinomys teguina]
MDAEKMKTEKRVAVITVLFSARGGYISASKCHQITNVHQTSERSSHGKRRDVERIEKESRPGLIFGGTPRPSSVIIQSFEEIPEHWGDKTSLGQGSELRLENFIILPPLSEVSETVTPVDTQPSQQKP